MRTQRPIVVIRPEPGNAATVAALTTDQLPALAAPLFVPQPVAWTVPEPTAYLGLIVGSAQVFHCGGEGLAPLRALPAHAVGKATAAAARGAGFAVAACGSGGLDPLVAELAPGRWLRLAGAERTMLVPPAEVIIDTVTVYRMAAQPLSESVAAQVRDGAVVLLHSAVAAMHFGAEIDRIGLARDRLALCCLAPRIAAAAGKGWRDVATAAEITDKAVLALASQMCQKL